jgi:hypothetical protein
MTNSAYITLQELIEMTKPFGCSRSLLYERYLTPPKKRKHGVRYTSRGHMRIPTAWAEWIVGDAQQKFREAPTRTSRLGAGLTAYRVCTVAGCERRTNQKDGVCRFGHGADPAGSNSG